LGRKTGIIDSKEGGGGVVVTIKSSSYGTTNFMGLLNKA